MGTTEAVAAMDVVTMSDIDARADPKNWNRKWKWAATLVVSGLNLMSPVSSSVSMIAPALPAIGQDFGVQDQAQLTLSLSIFVLCYAVGPLFLAPLSEIYGRVVVLQASNAIYLIFNTACGFARTEAQLVAFKVFAGIGGSAPLSIGGGVLADCWKAEERGKAMSVYLLAPILGPAIGPIAGGFITQYTSWRWVFMVMSILDAVILIAALFLLPETYGPRILQQEVKKMREETNNPNLRSEYENPDETLGSRLRLALVRPLRLLGTQAIVQILSVYMAFLYGMIYILLSTFPLLWTEVYGESESIGSLNYISLVVGYYIGSQFAAQTMDRMYCRLKARYSEEGRPEFRIPSMYLGDSLVVGGLFIYAWSASYRVHWIAPNIGAAVFSAGAMINI